MFSPDFAGQSSRCHPMAMASRNADLLRETVGAQGFRGFRGSGFTSEILKDGVWGIVVALVSPKSQHQKPNAIVRLEVSKWLQLVEW